MTKVKFSLPRMLPLSRRSSLATSRSGWLSQQPRGDVEVVVVEEDPRLGLLGGRLALLRFLLDEVRDRRDRRVDALVEPPVDAERRVEAHRPHRHVVWGRSRHDGRAGRALGAHRRHRCVGRLRPGGARHREQGDRRRREPSPASRCWMPATVRLVHYGVIVAAGERKGKRETTTTRRQVDHGGIAVDRLRAPQDVPMVEEVAPFRPQQEGTSPGPSDAPRRSPCSIGLREPQG